MYDLIIYSIEFWIVQNLGTSSCSEPLFPRCLNVTLLVHG